MSGFPDVIIKPGFKTSPDRQLDDGLSQSLSEIISNTTFQAFINFILQIVIENCFSLAVQLSNVSDHSDNDVSRIQMGLIFLTHKNVSLGAKRLIHHSPLLGFPQAPSFIFKYWQVVVLLFFKALPTFVV